MGAAEPALFAFEEVRVVVAGRVLLAGVDAIVPADGVTVVLGASGSGKSTLLRLCNGLESPSSGRVLYRGGDLASIDPLAHRRSVGMVFQQPVPFGGTVRDNMRVASADAGEGRMLAALARAHLPPSFLDRPAGELSGGESQRACLARTLVTEPQVLLMDEPTSALYEAARLALECLAVELAVEGVPVLWVTHDLDQAIRLGRWVIVLAEGRVLASGPPAEPTVARHMRPHAETAVHG
jgi:putative ABC transport system ATP-binding protein